MSATVPPPPSPPPTRNLALSPRSEVLVALSWIATSFAIVITIFRLYLRQTFHHSIALDDWLMLLALIFHILFQCFLTLTCLAGLGHPLTSMSPQNLVDLTKWAWFATPGSILASTVARISIAIVFVQIFGNRKWYKYLMISYTCLLAVVGLLNFIFVRTQARPVEALWDFRIVATYRMEQLPQKIITCVLMITFSISDLLYTIFPVAFIWKLHMQRRKRFTLMALMAGSIITLGIAVGRTTIVFQSLFEKTDVDAAMDSDRTFIFFGVGSLLASIEQSSVIVIGSIPKLKVAGKLKFPKLHSSLNTFFNKLRYGTQVSTSAPGTNQSWDYAGLELESTSKRNLRGQANCDSTVHTGSMRQGKHPQDKNIQGIHVIEDYSVTYERPQDAKNAVERPTARGC